VTNQNRRTFLATIGAAALGTMGLAGTACATNGNARGSRRINRIGLQLYTVRDLMQADLPGTLAQVAAAGYKEVEFAGYFGRSPTEIRDLLARNGLTSPSAHIGIEQMEQNFQKVADDAKVIGHKWVTVPYLQENQRNNWKGLAAQLNRLGAQAKANGLRLAYHNHDFEIRPVNGVRPLDVLLDNTDPALVDSEMDLYWVTFGGGDPLDFFNRHPGRIKMVHVKDSAGPPDNKMADVGKGVINWRAIFAQSDKAGIQHYFVEHDQPANPLQSIRNSASYLSTLTY
jgi:sugar phosphate isomerase/epimerase